eukprot:m.148064 g.148064  ORF g.148064 m.148064 type:complete len:542 (+) comp23189_c0_seq1:99-1724(+)
MNAVKAAVSSAFNRLADAGDTGAPAPTQPNQDSGHVNSTVSPSSSSSAAHKDASPVHTLAVVDVQTIADDELQDLEFLDAYDGDDPAACESGGATAAASNRNVEGVPDEVDQCDDHPPPARQLCSAAEIDTGPESLVSVYGQPESPERAAELCPPGDEGLVYHAQLVPDDWTHPEHCTTGGQIKPRRAVLPVREKDFFASLVQTADGRWLFSGVLNGWPALTCLEVKSITCIARLGLRAMVGLEKLQVVRFWDATNPEQRGVAPSFPQGLRSVRVTLRAPHWTTRGWSATSPGNCWWFESRRAEGPRLSHGEGMITNLKSDVAAGRFGGLEPVCTHVHHFSHRYARPGIGGRETSKQSVTYHGAILLEWSHGQYCTVVELATLNGVGGRWGRANWYADKLADSPELYRAMPPAMICPWAGQFAEVRCHDVKATSLEEFKDFVGEFTGTELRFLDPHFFQSAPVRLAMRHQTDIHRYFLNYVGRDRRYTESFRNCQTFAADCFGFLAGKVGVEPYHPVNRVGYTNRGHNFLYQPDLYGPPHE